MKKISSVAIKNNFILYFTLSAVLHLKINKLIKTNTIDYFEKTLLEFYYFLCVSFKFK